MAERRTSRQVLGYGAAAHVAFLDEGAFERWSKPTERGIRRLAGIDLNKARNRHVVDAVVVALSTRPGIASRARAANGDFYFHASIDTQGEADCGDFGSAEPLRFRRRPMSKIRLWADQR